MIILLACIAMLAMGIVMRKLANKIASSALQFSADGMDAVELKEKYGDRLCFEGGVSVQTTLPFGNPKDVQREVKELITALGKNGGYILGPSHAIQAGTPPQNIVAMFDTASSFYPF